VENFKLTAKFRYRQQDEKVEMIRKADGNYLVNFAQPVKAVTEGQEAVFYLNDQCLGGGIIDIVYQ
jgi:tRNA-specific 2-thiouridylase